MAMGGGQYLPLHERNKTYREGGVGREGCSPGRHGVGGVWPRETWGGRGVAQGDMGWEGCGPGRHGVGGVWPRETWGGRGVVQGDIVAEGGITVLCKFVQVILMSYLGALQDFHMYMLICTSSGPRV